MPSTTSARTPDTLTELRDFALEFFTFNGADVKRVNKRKHGPIEVLLPPPLVEHFGKEQMTLVFDSRELEKDSDLVAYGSRVFDRMLTYLDQRSALTVQRLPNRFDSSEALMPAARPVNASIANLKMDERLQHLLVYNWRITYRADDKREELFTVALDESGARVLIDDGTNGSPKNSDGLNDNRPNDNSQVSIRQMMIDAQPLPEEEGPDGQPLPIRLPPMTQLARLAETARKFAIYHADVRCVTHEAEILPRLHKALTRLTNYYNQQIEEVYETHDPTGEKRQTLETDLERKIAEEVENHRLRVDVRLVSYALIQLPTAAADITLSDGKQEVPIRVRLNRYTGALQRPACHGCGEEAETIALDRNGHVTCDDCLYQCAFCMDILCADCGVEPCPVCAQSSCDTCGTMCWACGGRACTDHISTCPTCRDPVCHSCQAECVTCGVRQCRSHLRVDHVLTKDGTEAFVCGRVCRALCGLSAI